MTARDLAERPDAVAREERSTLGARYRSLFVLGRGGMGSVEAALEIASCADASTGTDDASAYQRVVALKRLLPDAAHDRRRADMFLREARLAAMLDHPNVVRAYDYGEIDGELYLSMEYVEGQPLSRLLRAVTDAKRRMSPATAAHVLAEVCRGLHAAHELTDPSTGLPLGLVHRDVSPQNVMIGYDGRVRLLDFGVAKIETENLTKTGEVKGKSAYMSPEQAMGDALDRRSDLFGVGAILFECLALRRMWGDGTDMDVIRKLALESPPLLETCGVSLPDGLSALHARLVARDAKDRPATALDVAKALETFAGEANTAAETLREILATYFSDEANERRAQLTSSLEAVAPERADYLRESILPDTSTSSNRDRARGAAVETEVPQPPRRSIAVALGISILVLVSGIAWWRGGRSPSAASPVQTPSAIATTVPPPVTTASSTQMTTTASAPTERPTASSNRAAVTPPARSLPVTPPVVTTTVQPHATPLPKPAEVDEKPF